MGYRLGKACIAKTKTIYTFSTLNSYQLHNPNYALSNVMGERFDWKGSRLATCGNRPVTTELRRHPIRVHLSLLYPTHIRLFLLQNDKRIYFYWSFLSARKNISSSSGDFTITFFITITHIVLEFCFDHWYTFVYCSTIVPNPRYHTTSWSVHQRLQTGVSCWCCRCSVKESRQKKH